jgi:hypothetical protein
MTGGGADVFSQAKAAEGVITARDATLLCADLLRCALP